MILHANNYVKWKNEMKKIEYFCLFIEENPFIGKIFIENPDIG